MALVARSHFPFVCIQIDFSPLFLFSLIAFPPPLPFSIVAERCSTSTDLQAQRPTAGEHVKV